MAALQSALDKVDVLRELHIREALQLGGDRAKVGHRAEAGDALVGVLSPKLPRRQDKEPVKGEGDDVRHAVQEGQHILPDGLRRQQIVVVPMLNNVPTRRACGERALLANRPPQV